MAEKRRVFQIAEKIRNTLAVEVIHAADPRLELVTITSVKISPDLRNARVYWVVNGDEYRRKEAAEAFAAASRLFRRAMAKDLGVRYVPDLKFFYDDTLDTRAGVDQLLKRVQDEDLRRNGEAPLPENEEILEADE